MTTLVTDDFNRANEAALAAPWVKVFASNPSFSLTSNALVYTSSADQYYYLPGVAAADMWAEASYASLTSDDWGPAVRVNGAGHTGVVEGYFYDPTSSGGIGRHFNGVYTGVVTQAGVPSRVVGDVLRMEVVGSGPSAVKGYINGALILSGTDASASEIKNAGNGVGIFAFAMTGADNFQGGDFSPSTPQVLLHAASQMRGRSL